MDSPTSSDLHKRIKEICVYLHTELTSMVISTQQDSHEEDSFMSLDDVLSLDVSSALDHLEAALRELLTAKRELLEMSQYSAVVDAERYGKAMQKLEGEIRGHIQAEHQMALHIELLQQKVEDDEKEKNRLITSYEELMQKLQTDNETLCLKLKLFENRATDRPQTALRKGTKSVADLKFRKLPLPLSIKEAAKDSAKSGSAHSDLHDPRAIESSRGDTARVRPRAGIGREASSRSISPLIATVRRGEGTIRDIYARVAGRLRRKGKNRSVSTERLQGSKSTSKIA
jgi:hypothetical protein